MQWSAITLAHALALCEIHGTTMDANNTHGQTHQVILDESNHINVFLNLLNSLVMENPEIMTPEFKEDLRQTMAEGVRLEKEFIRDCLPVDSVGLSVAEFEQYIDYISDRRLVNCHLEPLAGGNVENPFPWLSEAIDLKKEQNFFEGKVTEYQKASALEDSGYTDDDL